MVVRLATTVTLLLLTTLLPAACGNTPDATPTPTRPAVAPTATAAALTSPTATDVPTATTVSSSTVTTTSASQPVAGTVTFRIVPDQSEARYRAREQLLGRSLPNDAVGRTNAVAGQVVFAADGTIDSQQSRVTVDLTTLQSDEARRDNYIKRNTLEVDQFPTAEFQPTAVSGLPWPLPTSGQLQFQLEGNLTVHGVTKPVTWHVEAAVDGNRITGTATTQVTFEDFGMTPPRVPVVLSLEDTITLELDFTVERVP
ncbi:YceI family protein [Thermomicrobium sp. 4228-Ro]|uniref:YceI family protein n=1 Tax=Thermomicrobium sp. 4228-Ro TaxID=2993937 RepID=UPI002248FD6F|nr:YceI family protein [Thermomicrobium sp. 4228-Ro]MCX2727772.1 YceI family protein [Thermomicrobium sp. 4228-Ro]